jgi:hypothetical protein
VPDSGNGAWTAGQVITAPRMNALEAALVNSLDKGGDEMTGPLAVDQAAPTAGQVREYTTFEQAGVARFRQGLDASGNLVLQRWTGSAWSTVATFPVTGGVATGLNADQVDGLHFREASGQLEYSSNGTMWKKAGTPESKTFLQALLF